MRQIFKNSTQLALTSVLSLTLCAALCMGQAQAQDNMSKGRSRGQRTSSDRNRMADRGHMDDTMMDEDEMGMPATPSYPMAAPGSLDLNHWTDYSRMHMRSGSAAEARMDRRMHSMEHGSEAMGTMEDEDNLIPVTPSYPRAAPGAIDMYYWTDYTHKHMQAGNASETRMDRMHDKDRGHMASMMHDEDEDDLLPVAPSYPRAAPGSLDMNYWTDLTRMHMMPGSASEARMDRMMKKDSMKKDRMKKMP